MNQNIENMIRVELERMGIVQDNRQQQRPQPQHVPVEAILSATIGDHPISAPSPIRGLNDDHGLARAIGADTLNGKRL